ncbi:MAG: metal ABC transporter permease [Desulfosarcinaceae bacterium]|nr:metal ABC transporter permease [Desulfosarcinaceae bacterium]
MEWTSFDTWIVVTGALSAAACALLGNYLVLRKLSMMGDAISHAVLPGLALAFIITGSRDSLPMLVGATAIGVLTAFLVQALFRLSELEKGATMGVIFTTFFALGLILIRQAADHVDLDPSCVLYGAIELTPLDVYELMGMEIPRAALTNLGMLAVNLLFVGLFYKELKITSFDPALATTLGINATFLHYALMTLVAATTVAAFESVGSILVIAMLIVPAATAHLLTDRLGAMLVISVLIAALSALLGHLGAITVPTWFGFTDTSTAGMMGVATGLIFLVTFLLAPRYGVVSRVLRQWQLSLKIVADDVLGFLYRYEELKQPQSPPVQAGDLQKALKAGGSLWPALWQLKRRGAIRQTADDVLPTETGLAQGARLVRSHRLWESYLCDALQMCPTDVHALAHDLEHFTDASMSEALARQSGDPNIDPHERQIPPLPK